MRSTKSAIRYAKAILELSKDAGTTDSVAADMNRIISAGNETGEFQIFLNSPVIKTDKKISILHVLFSDFCELSMSFVVLIAKNNSRPYNISDSSIVSKEIHGWNGQEQLNVETVRVNLFFL